MSIKLVWETAFTDYKVNDVEGAGKIRYDSNGCVYRWVQNLNFAVAFLAGQPVNYDVTAAIATRFQGAIACAAGNQEASAGIAMSAIPAKYYGWIQCKGISVTALLMNSTSTAVVVGDTLSLISTATSLTFGSAGGNIPAKVPFLAMSSQASGTSVVAAASVLLDCMY